MDNLYYNEMVRNLDDLERTHPLQEKHIYLFGHCNATEELADLLIERNYAIKAILDNNQSKQGKSEKGIPILPPAAILQEDMPKTIVCIVARAYAAMNAQLRKLGFCGEIIKLVDYNSFSEYSLSKSVIAQKQERVERGMQIKISLEQNYPNCFKIFCPFSALGDVFFTMSYLPYYLEKKEIKNCVICVIGDACRQVVELFGSYSVMVYTQKDLDELIQACLYNNDRHFFIAHQDRPYVINLHKALYVKRIPLEQIYCCGVFGLPPETKPVKPKLEKMQQYSGLRDICKGKAVILSPYAKSVTALPKSLWDDIVQYYKSKGYQCFTNIAKGEQALAGTLQISPTIHELQSVAEYAGTFIGIRSGLCDVLKYAKCKKIALYPDYNYCDTNWKAIDMYALEGWKNIVVKDDFQWEKANIVHLAKNIVLT